MYPFDSPSTVSPRDGPRTVERPSTVSSRLASGEGEWGGVWCRAALSHTPLATSPLATSPLATREPVATRMRARTCGRLGLVKGDPGPARGPPVEEHALHEHGVSRAGPRHCAARARPRPDAAKCRGEELILIRINCKAATQQRAAAARRGLMRRRRGAG